jgi:hypothetical protein
VPINVFLSVGRPSTEAQETFIATVEHHLKQSGLRSWTVGRNTHTHRPLERVADLMERSAGALVIALERIFVDEGVEHRGGSDQKSIARSMISTPWNQIEAAFAYAKRVPLLVIKEDTVRADGLLEPKYDWYVYSTALSRPFLSAPEFEEVFDSWHRDVRRKAGWFGFRR